MSPGWKEVKEALKKDRVFNSKWSTHSTGTHARTIFVHKCQSRNTEFTFYSNLLLTTGTRIEKQIIGAKKCLRSGSSRIPVDMPFPDLDPHCYYDPDQEAVKFSTLKLFFTNSDTKKICTF